MQCLSMYVIESSWEEINFFYSVVGLVEQYARKFPFHAFFPLLKVEFLPFRAFLSILQRSSPI